MHFNLTFKEQQDQRCNNCGRKTVLVTFGNLAEIHPEKSSKEEQRVIEVNEELTGHFCVKCHEITAVFVNT